MWAAPTAFFLWWPIAPCILAAKISHAITDCIMTENGDGRLISVATLTRTYARIGRPASRLINSNDADKFSSDCLSLVATTQTWPTGVNDARPSLRPKTMSLSTPLALHGVHCSARRNPAMHLTISGLSRGHDMLPRILTARRVGRRCRTS